MIWAAKCVSTV